MKSETILHIDAILHDSILSERELVLALEMLRRQIPHEITPLRALKIVGRGLPSVSWVMKPLSAVEDYDLPIALEKLAAGTMVTLINQYVVAAEHHFYGVVMQDTERGNPALVVVRNVDSNWNPDPNPDYIMFERKSVDG